MGKGIVIGFLLALVLLAVGAYCYFGFGMAPVATASAPMPFEKFLANRALKAVVSKAADRPSPVSASVENMARGAVVYREQCAVCHGLPDQEVTATAKGMFPKPPQLFHGKGVTDDPVGETFWKVQNGIRMTGMPSYQGTLSEEQMWQVSQLLLNADKLPAGAKEELVRKSK
jgi:thiosulfate dehydrogenase